MSEAIASSSSDNPHAMPAAAMSMARWVLRLHLAHFLITGRFPFVHQFLNLQRKQEPSRIADPPPTTHVLVGKLILLQAGASLTQALARWFATHVAKARRDEQRVAQDAVPPALSNNQPCGICRTPRLHSAVPSACGHVFCWQCLYQWVSTVRPECPLCRSACRPQDIVALYHYEPS